MGTKRKCANGRKKFGPRIRAIILATAMVVCLTEGCRNPTESQEKSWTQDELLKETSYVEFNLEESPVGAFNDRLTVATYIYFKQDSSVYGFQNVEIQDSLNRCRWVYSVWDWSDSLRRIATRKGFDLDSVPIDYYFVCFTFRNGSKCKIPLKMWARNDTNLNTVCYASESGKNPSVFHCPTITGVSPGMGDSLMASFVNNDTLSVRLAYVLFYDRSGRSLPTLFRSSHAIAVGSNHIPFVPANDAIYFVIVLYSRVNGTFKSDYVAYSALLSLTP